MAGELGLQRTNPKPPVRSKDTNGHDVDLEPRAVKRLHPAADGTDENVAEVACHGRMAASRSLCHMTRSGCGGEAWRMAEADLAA